METLQNNNNLTDFSLDKDSSSTIMSIQAVASVSSEDYYDEDGQSVPIMFDLVPVREGEVIELKFYLEQFVSHENLSQLIKECENYKNFIMNSTPYSPADQEPAVTPSSSTPYADHENESEEEGNLIIVLDESDKEHDNVEETSAITTTMEPGQVHMDKSGVTTKTSVDAGEARKTNRKPETKKRAIRMKKRIKSLRKPPSRDGPVSCPICGKSIAQKKNLNVHLNVHKKPYSCTSCSRRFAHEYLLNRHRVHHQKRSTTTTVAVTAAATTELSKT